MGNKNNITELFPDVRPLSKVALRILKKRYFIDKNENWEGLVGRVIKNVVKKMNKKNRELTKEMILNRYFVPNSPCLVNAGTKSSGLLACFVVDFPDDIEGIFKTKLDFALIARKAGGAGTSLDQIRPEGDPVAGSVHGYAGGGINFANTISHDMDVISQGGLRSMAIMFTMSVYHPDVTKFINAKKDEGKIANANLSVVVDDKFMNAVKNDDYYWTEFGDKKYHKYKAKDIFDMIVEGAWRNGEPAIMFKDRIDQSPFTEVGQKIFSTNPCFTGDMKLLTRSGLKAFKELSSLESVDIINFIGNISTGKVWLSGKKETISLEMSNGDTIKCTPDHIFMIDDGSECVASDTIGKKILMFTANDPSVDTAYSKSEVVSISPNGIEEVYDFSEPSTHWGVVNGFISHNCGEIPLPKNSSCNIGSLDISKFVDNDGDLNESLLEIASRLGVRFLDEVVDASLYPTKEIEQRAKENRPVALGIMGLADYFLIKKIAYGSDEASIEVERILKIISESSYSESEIIGMEHGIPKECKKLKKPRRNITLNTVAPTGSTSLIAGCSSGIEAIFSEITVRNDKTGSYVFNNDLANEPYFRCAVSSNDREEFEVKWHEHIEMVSAAQKFIDQGISKTINFPKHTHKETVAKAIMLAWEKECKGIAIYRNESRKIEVLSTSRE